LKRFRFSLETVLKLRRQVEELRQRELAEVQARRQRALAELGAFENGLRALLQEQAALGAGRIDLNTLAWYQARCRGFNDSIKACRRKTEELAKAEELARQRAVEAAKERRLLERLEESQRQDWLRKLNSEEQGFLDDLAQRTLSVMESLPVSAA
jgi:flagellar FliJ protein